MSLEIISIIVFGILGTIIGLALVFLDCYGYYRYYKIENCQKKKEIFDLFNNFLLLLETIVNAESYGMKKYNIADNQIDIQCLNVIGKVHCFSQINNLSEKSSKKNK